MPSIIDAFKYHFRDVTQMVPSKAKTNPDKPTVD